MSWSVLNGRNTIWSTVNRLEGSEGRRRETVGAAAIRLEGEDGSRGQDDSEEGVSSSQNLHLVGRQNQQDSPMGLDWRKERLKDDSKIFSSGK